MTMKISSFLVKKQGFLRLDYMFLGAVVVFALALPQYSLSYNPTNTIFALDSAKTQASTSLVPALAASYNNSATGYILVQSNAFKASAALPVVKSPRTSWIMWIPVTAYSSTPDQTDGDPFITASGEAVRNGIIAANFLPMHTKVRFPTIYGDKIFEVKDRMNSRYLYRADIWMPTRWQALEFGLRTVPIEILRG